MKIYLNHSTTEMIHNDAAKAMSWHRAGDKVEVLTYDDMGKMLSAEIMAPLKTNSKQARENIQFYIRNHFTPDGYDLETAPETFPEIARCIMQTFRKEKYYSPEYMAMHNITEYMAFRDWAQGLPSMLDTCYYYNRSAVDDVAAILWQRPEQSAKYAESEAEELLTFLIYRELLKGAVK